MSVQQTSLLAYWSLNDLSKRQRQVFNVIQEIGAVCNLDISEALNRPINTITPRTNELVEKGIVEEAYRAPSKQTGRQAIYWRIK